MFIQEHELHITHGPDEDYLGEVRTNPHMLDAEASWHHLGRNKKGLFQGS